MHQIESSSPPVVRAAGACGSSNVQNMHGGAMVVRVAGLKNQRASNVDCCYNNKTTQMLVTSGPPLITQER